MLARLIGALLVDLGWRLFWRSIKYALVESAFRR